MEKINPVGALTKEEEEEIQDEGSKSREEQDLRRLLRRVQIAGMAERALADRLDDRAIDQVLEAMDEERAALDVGEIGNARRSGRH